jgi:hypothetical protein
MKKLFLILAAAGLWACGDAQVPTQDEGEACEGPSDALICQAKGAVCGVVTLVDYCGVERTVDCGSDCSCTPESDEEFCSNNARNCGEYEGKDNCGQTRVVDCGSCSGSDTCQILSRSSRCSDPNSRGSSVSSSWNGCPKGYQPSGGACQPAVSPQEANQDY